jgi:hypothetical protein
MAKSREVDVRLTNLLARDLCVEGFIELGSMPSTIELLNEVYGLNLNVDPQRESNVGQTKMIDAKNGLMSFTLPSLLIDVDNRQNAKESYDSVEVHKILFEFLETRRYDVERMSSWANGNEPSFYKDFFMSEKFWGQQPGLPRHIHRASDLTFSPKLSSSKDLKKQRVICRRVSNSASALWAARLFIDKVCIPNGIFVSAIVRQVVTVPDDFTSVHTSDTKPIIEIVPFDDYKGGVLCETSFSIFKAFTGIDWSEFNV